MSWAADVIAAFNGVTDLLGSLEARVSGLEDRVAKLEAPPTSPALWAFDGSDLAAWYAPAPLGMPNAAGPGAGGGEYDSGSYVPVSLARIADKPCAKLTINSSGGVRLFRWREPTVYSDLWYEAWYYFPRTTSCSWSNHMQWKSKTPAGRNDPFWFLEAKNRPNGNMYFRLVWWNGLTIEGPHQSESGGRNYEQIVRDIPIGQWFQIKAHLVSAFDFTGRLTVWQDGVELFDMQGVKTRYADGDQQWSVNNYGSGVFPAPSDVYITDLLLKEGQ